MAPLFRRILVPHDASDHANHALRVAVRLARETGGAITVLHAISPFLPFADHGADPSAAWIPPDDIVELESRALGRMVRRVLPRSGGPGVETRVVVGEPYREILRAAERADLVVMSTHGRGGLEHLVIGSIAEKVVRHCPVPVLTIRRNPPRGARRGSGGKRR